MEKLYIFTDGAARGNPGPAAIAFVFVKNNKIIKSSSSYIGETTNNSAEYRAIIDALMEAKIYSTQNISINSDSQLVIRQLNDIYKVRKKHLQAYYNKVQELKKQFKKIEFKHVKRNHKFIQECDRLCNLTLDKQ
jgi:ribonuclease HI